MSAVTPETLRTAENDQPDSSPWVRQELEGFSGKVSNWQLAEVRCPACGQIGKVDYADRTVREHESRNRPHHRGRGLFDQQAANVFSTTSGLSSIIRKRTRAMASGRRRPCSQFRRVGSGMPKFKANSGWDMPSFSRTALTLMLSGTRTTRAHAGTVVAFHVGDGFAHPWNDFGTRHASTLLRCPSSG